MKQDCYIEIAWKEKLKLWCRALFYALIILVKNVVNKFLRKTIQFSHLDKPMPCLIESSLGGHMYVKVNGVKLHYVLSGDKKLPLILLLHGFPDCWLGWRHQMKVLAKNFRVVALDLKGFGDSEKPQWRRHYGIPILLKELRQFVHTQGVKRCIVIGHDLGAILGWFLSAQHPSLVTKFVSISGAHPNIHWGNLINGPAYSSKFIELCQIPFLPESEMRKDNLAMVEGFFKHLEKIGELNIKDAYKYVFSRPQDVSGPLHYLRSLPLFKLREAKLRVPTLLLIGTKDPYLPVEALVRSASYLVNYEMKLVEGAGHFPHQEAPIAVNELIQTFLLGSRLETQEKKVDVPRSLLGNLVSSTFKYGNTIVDNVVKSTNSVVWKPTNVK